MGAVAYFLVAVVLYFATVVVYRLYLSPLANIPGPKIAAATSLYSAYHDLIRRGQYVRVIEEMHRRYGSVVRIQPDTVHVCDPRFIEKLYTQSPKHRRERHRTVLNMLQAPGSILATKDHDLHRRRRAVLNPYLSMQNVRRLESVISDTLANLLRRMDLWAAAGPIPIRMNPPLRASTSDIIRIYAFGEDNRFLDQEDCNSPFFDVIGPSPISHLGTHIPWLTYFMASLPPAIMTALIPRIGVFASFVIGLESKVKAIKNDKEWRGRPTIFHDMIRDETLPPAEKSTDRLTDEAMIITIAGSDTTASTLAAIIYEVLADKKLLDRLQAELRPAVGDGAKVDPSKLAALPFLNALIEEAIRFYPGATHRQDRVAPDEDLVYTDPDTGKSVVIPAGTGIGMAAPLVNRDKRIYGESADDFIPQRYLDDPTLRKYQFSFSKGARQCIGINLAYLELQMFVAGIFSKYDLYDPTKQQTGPTLELYDSTRQEVEMYSDFVTPGLPKGSQGLRLIIRQ
ncbi:hypothetical protein ANO11243_050210 [Dothideomycetidae sp. 11243]|nr:hypothetical protein ANO11243_050210 [fungal sp. No.11243]